MVGVREAEQGCYVSGEATMAAVLCCNGTWDSLLRSVSTSDGPLSQKKHRQMVRRRHPFLYTITVIYILLRVENL